MREIIIIRWYIGMMREIIIIRCRVYRDGVREIIIIMVGI